MTNNKSQIIVEPLVLTDLEKLYLFLNKYKTKKTYTHSNKCIPYGNFNIPEHAQKEFMSLYINAVVAGHKLSIVEKHTDIGPIVIELKFIQNDNSESHYCISLLKNIIRIYNIIIKKYLNISNNDLRAFVFETTDLIHRQKSYQKIIRIIYPFICTKPSLQFFMRNIFFEKIEKKNTFNGIPFVNTINEIFDSAIIYQYDWFMFGSSHNTKISFMLTHIFLTTSKCIYDVLLPNTPLDNDSIKYFVEILSVRKNINAMTYLNNSIDPADIDSAIFDSKNSNNKTAEKNIVNNTIDVKYLFGTGYSNYSADELKKLVVSGLVDEAKNYVRKFFVKVANPPGILFWKHYDNSMIHYKFDEIKSLFISKISNGNFNVQNWFFHEEMTVYFRDMNLSKGRIYSEENQMCINSFPGFLHKTYKKFNEYPLNIQKDVNLIWDHINIVWCSNNKILFEYNKNWICLSVSGRKMTTCLYLKSIQGTGKSATTEFLAKYVFGPKISYVTSNPDCLFTFNQQIYGKLLLIFEELPSMNKNQWCVIGNALKHFITGKTYTNKEKNKTDFETPNNFSIIICTNNNAIKIDTDDRRMIVNDVSHSKIGDTNYFNKLFAATNNPTVGEAFYSYCLEHAHANKNFREFPPPFSESKKDLIIENMHSLFIFIKETYIKTVQDIDITFSDFYCNYTNYLIQNKSNSNVSKITVSKLLSNHNLGLFTNTGNVKYITISARDLYKIFNNNKWIHDIDDIHHLYNKL